MIEEFEAIMAGQTMPTGPTRPQREVVSEQSTSFAIVNTDGSIESTVIAELPTHPLPDGQVVVEGSFDIRTDAFDMPIHSPQAQGAGVQGGPTTLSSPKVRKQTTMDAVLTVIDGVPADGVSIASITGIPAKSVMRTPTLGTENIDDGILTMTFDTPGQYDISFTHKGWLDTTVTITAIPVSSP